MPSKRLWLEETLQDDLKWSFSVHKILHTEVSEFQDVELVETGPFGKVLLLDGKLQSAEADEFVYHECLVQPAMLHHPAPKRVFIMGGGEGATAREVLRHKSVELCVMADIDKVVCDFCEMHLEANQAAFRDKRFELIIDDAKKSLESYEGTFDVIIGDLADPVYGGPCYQLYTADFYETVVKKKLAPGGVFVTQSGPAGVLSHKEVYTAINRTLREVFPRVVPYAAHVPSFSDTWGWNMAFTEAGKEPMSEAEFDKAAKRVTGELSFLDGTAFKGATGLNKAVRKGLAEEEHVLSVDKPRFIHGSGLGFDGSGFDGDKTDGSKKRKA